MSKNFAIDKLRILTNKTKTATIALVLVLTITATLLTALPTVNAADVETFARLSVVPNPIGVGQTLLVNVWLTPFPPAPRNVYSNFTVTFTKPDGTIDKIGPLTSDVIGGAWFNYVPGTTGKWYVQFSFPGQNFGAQGNFKASTSPKVELVVQQEPILPWPAAGLPTDYWTRPINTENREWYTIAGNWLLGSYNATGKFNPYTKAPNTAHIAWTKEVQLGGLVGGEAGTIPYYAGMFYDARAPPSIIMNGKLYYNIPWGGSANSGGGAVCVDLRTGEQLWWKNMTITCGQLLNFYGLSQAGGYLPYLWYMGTQPMGGGLTGTTYQMFDAFTGNLVMSFKSGLTGTIVFDKMGNLLVYVINGPAGWLAMWNSTKAILKQISPTNPSPSSWKPVAGIYNWKDGVQWNTTIPKTSVTWSVRSIASGVILTRSSESITSTYNAYVAFSAKDGHQLWGVKNITGFTIIDASAANGIWVQYYTTELKFHAFDLYTGNELWVSDPRKAPWGCYSGAGPVHAYGNMYEGAYDGYIRAWNTQTGKQVWEYSSGNSGYETPFGTWPFLGGVLVADGKVYAHTEEHTPPQPVWRGGRLFCIDAYTGEGIWSIGAILQEKSVADGYLVTFNAYDGFLYCFGRGQTATTVSASPAVTTNGSSVLIEGTVLDQSPGQPGTPCVSVKSMSQWMEYLHMQKPMPTNTTGVPVDLRAMRSDGSIIEIGTVTSDVSGHFKYKWIPPTTDTYTITATFNGDDSYGSSWAETGLGVDPAPAAAEPVEIPAYPDNTPLFAGLIVAVVIAIVIGLVNLLMLRKRK